MDRKIVIINVVTINSLKGKSFCHFSKIMFESEIAETPNKNAIIGTGNSKKIPNNAKVGAKHRVHKLTIERVTERIAAPIVEDMIAVSSLLNFNLKIENIIDKTIKIAVIKAGIINSHLG